MPWHIRQKKKLIDMSESLDFLEIEGKIVEALKKVYDPEIPVNIYDLGLIYEINYDENRVAHIRMTLTAPNCPVVDMLLMDVENAVEAAYIRDTENDGELSPKSEDGRE